MPKKRVLNLKQFQGSSSSATKPAGQDGGDSPTSTVNERLNDLRKAESLDAEQKKRELAELVTQKTVPPEVRAILGVPESAPPRPKVGPRFRDRMRTPGPAAPKSWLAVRPEWETTLAVRGGGGRKGKRALNVIKDRNRPSQLQRFAQLLHEQQNLSTSRPSRLVHQILKRLAEHWDLLDEEDYPNLVEIPLRLRLQLLSYLGHYGPPIDAIALQALIQGDDQVIHLDLGGLAGHAPLTLKKLIRVLKPPKPSTSHINSEVILDSWDAEDDVAMAPLSVPAISRFANLTHLCLSNPPDNVPWRELLALSKHTPQVTHLSLAYWPRPTLTPNLSTATVSSRHGPDVTAGGSHYYSALDEDMTEPASLLRQLSSNLLCLQWLDIEGCAQWMPALATLAAAAPLHIPEEGEDAAPAGDMWTDVRPAVMTIFADTWKGLNFIRCAQGTYPTSVGVSALGSTAGDEIRTPLLKYLLKQGDSFQASSFDTRDMYKVEERRARIWMEREQSMLAAGRRINNIRRARSCRPVVFDFGWMQKAV